MKLDYPGIDILGYEVKDVITGINGVATSMSFDLYGCVQILVRPGMKENEKGLPEAHWFDLNRVKITKKKRIMKPIDFRSYPTMKVPGPENKPPCGKSQESYKKEGLHESKVRYRRLGGSQGRTRGKVSNTGHSAAKPK